MLAKVVVRLDVGVVCRGLASRMRKKEYRIFLGGHRCMNQRRFGNRLAQLSSVKREQKIKEQGDE